MVQVVVDATMQSKLHNFSQPVELCDTTGRVLGRVIPADDLVPQVSEEELDRREQANENRYTTAEVLAHLEKLGRCIVAP
jgi:hypothetical protein